MTPLGVGGEWTGRDRLAPQDLMPQCPALRRTDVPGGLVPHLVLRSEVEGERAESVLPANPGPASPPERWGPNSVMLLTTNNSTQMHPKSIWPLAQHVTLRMEPSF